MSIQFEIRQQVLRVDDARETVEVMVHKYDAFLNLLCGQRYAFQRDAVRAALRFLVSDKYPDLERLARENYNAHETIRQRHASIDAYLNKMPLRGRKAASLDLATGTGKSFVMYALAAIALAEGFADRVLVLCPSLTIEDGLLEKFAALAGDIELAEILKELGAVHRIPGIRRGNETIQPGDICIENIHAVYQNAGSSIADSFKRHGVRTLVLNDEAHHLFSPPEQGLKEWLKFLLRADYDFKQIVNVTGTAYTDNDYFPDVIYRYGLKQAIADKVVKKPDYKLEETYTAHDWQKTYAIHRKNWERYGEKVKPISIIVTQEIARCVEVWRELVEFLADKEKISFDEAMRKAIWVTSGIPSGASEKERVQAAYNTSGDDDSPEKRRKKNLSLLREVDERGNPVEWIVSVSMLTEGWDVKNVFQIVPHDSRAFNSKLLIAQVLGRGLRIPAGFDTPPLVTINNHEKWSGEIGNLLIEVLEVDNTLSWGYETARGQYAFPIHNLRYEAEQRTVEVKREQAGAPQLQFVPQARQTTEYDTYSETGRFAMEIEHKGNLEIKEAAQIMRLFLREKDEDLAKKWTKKRIQEFIVEGLTNAGQDTDFISKDNLLRLQQAFGPMFRELGKEHPRVSQKAKDLVLVDLTAIPRQTFSEASLKAHGHIYYVEDGHSPFTGPEAHLWGQYQKLLKQYEDAPDIASDAAKAIAPRLKRVNGACFKMPSNIHYASYKPERQFSDLLFQNAGLFAGFVKMPDQRGYSFPYSYKPARAARTHTANENFNPDFFLRVDGTNDILVVEVKFEDDDSNRNRAKCRDGLRHFETLNERLAEAKVGFPTNGGRAERTR